MEIFKITETHIKLAQRMVVSWDDCEFGAPAIDCKRPYGNSNVIGDMAEILGFPVSSDENAPYPEALVDYLVDIHKSMETALQIFLATGRMEIGTYVYDKNTNWVWQKA